MPNSPPDTGAQPREPGSGTVGQLDRPADGRVGERAKPNVEKLADRAPVPGRQGGADETGGAGVVGQLEGTLGQTRAGVVTDALGRSGDDGGDVGDRPVPEPRPGGGVGVVDGDGVALGAFQGTAPGKLRGDILPARDAEDPGELLGRSGRAVSDGGADDGEGKPPRGAGRRGRWRSSRRFFHAVLWRGGDMRPTGAPASCRAPWRSGPGRARRVVFHPIPVCLVDGALLAMADVAWQLPARLLDGELLVHQPPVGVVGRVDDGRAALA